MKIKKQTLKKMIQESLITALMKEPEAQKAFKDAVVATFDGITGKPINSAEDRLGWFINRLTKQIMDELNSPGAKATFLKHFENQRAASLQKGAAKPNPLDPDELELANLATTRSPQPAPNSAVSGVGPTQPRNLPRTNVGSGG